MYLDIGNSIIEAGLPPVGVHSTQKSFFLSLILTMCVDRKLEYVSKNVIRMSGEIFRKCLHPRETDSVDCVLNLG